MSLPMCIFTFLPMAMFLPTLTLGFRLIHVVSVIVMLVFILVFIPVLMPVLRPILMLVHFQFRALLFGCTFGTMNIARSKLGKGPMYHVFAWPATVAPENRVGGCRVLVKRRRESLSVRSWKSPEMPNTSLQFSDGRHFGMIIYDGLELGEVHAN